MVHVHSSNVHACLRAQVVMCSLHMHQYTKEQPGGGRKP